MHIHIAEDLNDLSRKYAYWLIEHIRYTLQKKSSSPAEKQIYTWALSGGSTPQHLFQLLSKSPFKEQIPWEKLHIFWGDERLVPFHDSRNNGKMAYDLLLQHVPVISSQVHYIPTEMKPEEAAQAYEKILHRYFDEQGFSFDLVMLGMGTNGHTLSLFPHTDVIHEKEKWVKAVFVDELSMYRITLTPVIVNRAFCATFLVSGKDKADMLKKVLQGPYQPDAYPAQIIRLTNNELHWFVDRDAASELTLSE
ncbi:6-phosphogluconolactonase [Thermoflavifilum thermophilum]|uniref:6-phosphogluconolactonase n=1 Tax=Thermoflavifilum thermophilum TaxID=1393122 RepID=A0A1I7NM91_9BACT|nr:6-phosphogluconolactonase [Thermoflavifilum thermophilum]SFV35776.1 6-phosphogluconolactonase [Thermoflavifilum thermophilum]